jgi:hypothetical protein
MPGREGANVTCGALVTGGGNHGSFGEKNFNYPERTVVLRPEPVRAEPG